LSTAPLATATPTAAVGAAGVPRLGLLGPAAVARRLQAGELVLRTGPFAFRLRSAHARVAEGVLAMYDQHLVLPADEPADFEVHIAGGLGLHRWLRPQARFVLDGRAVFEPLPAAHAYALMEWAMNWCISSHAHQYLIVHAAVVARGQAAMVLPAPPGSGKSTLCAALIHAGWRLLSDELALIDMASGAIHPLCRPVSLKNRSIEVIGRLAPQAQFSRTTRDTTKGDVAHLRPPAGDVALDQQTARARWIVYPRYDAGSATVATPRARANATVDLARNAFNFALQGEAGFERLCTVVQDCDCLDFRYSALPEALAFFDRLATA